MRFRAILTSAIRAVSRPYLVIPAAVVAVIALLAPPSVDDASAQGFRMQSSRGGYSGGGPSGGSSMTSRGMSNKSGVYSKSRPRPNGSAATGRSYPKGGMRGMGGSRPSGTTADNRYPKGDYRPPRRHWHPIYVPRRTVAAVPVMGNTPPANVSGGGGQPPSTPPVQSNRRPTAPAPPDNWGRYVPNEVVVEVASSVSPQAMAALLRRHRLTQLETVNLQFSGTSIRRLRIHDNRSVPTVVRALAADGVVTNVQPNLIARLQEIATPASPGQTFQQYALERMRMPEAHELANGNRVLIAVIDSGADTQHPELAGMVLDTFDAIGSGEQVHPHGTSIVGAIAARARLRGTAPGAHILVARAFGTNRGSMDGTTTDIVKSIEWAMQRGARIINMSFAGGRDPAVERRLTTARQRGIILVAAAGNAGPNSAPLYPAANPMVIAVTATDIDDRVFRAANRGNHIAVAAPGVDLWLPTLDGNYRRTSGTSFSAAEITGVIALMLERNAGLTPEAVRRALVSTARDLGAPGVDPQFGAGLVDAYQAVMSVAPAAPAADATPVTTSVGN
jgi:subtilisin family serine protease